MINKIFLKNPLFLCDKRNNQCCLNFSKVYERSTSTPILIQESLDMSMGITTSVRSVHPVGGKLILEEKLETGKVLRV